MKSSAIGNRLSSIGRRAAALAAAGVLALPAIAAAQGPDNRPIIAVLSFENTSIGKDAHDYDGVSKGIMELLATDLAGNPKFRVVERERVQKLLDEQNLSKSGAMDPATAVRVGKLLGAQYAIYGGFMNAGKQVVLTGHTTDMETGQITNPEKITAGTDDVLGVISQLSAKLASNMKLEAKPGMGARAPGGDGGATKGAAMQSGAPNPTKSAGTQAAAVEQYSYAKPLPAAAKKVKLDMEYMKIYSNALDAMDRKDTPKAKALLNKVVEKYADFTPAKDNLAKLM